MKVNTAAFTAEHNRQVAYNYQCNRSLALKLMYGIPGMHDAELATKNYIYDTVKAKLDGMKTE